VLGSLLFTTNTPDTTACTAGGYSSLYFLDYATGAAVSSSSNNIVGQSLGNSLATRPVVVLLPNGSIVVEIMMAAPVISGNGVGTPDGMQPCIGGDCWQAKPQDQTPPLDPPAATPRRSSWREIIIDR
jgi:Tfp pilus tip-associated adhesin PilY1